MARDAVGGAWFPARVLRVLVGLVIGVPIGWLASEVGRGWRAGTGRVIGRAPDAPPFAGDLAGLPRLPGEPTWLLDDLDPLARGGEGGTS